MRFNLHFVLGTLAAAVVAASPAQASVTHLLDSALSSPLADHAATQLDARPLDDGGGYDAVRHLIVYVEWFFGFCGFIGGYGLLGAMPALLLSDSMFEYWALAFGLLVAGPVLSASILDIVVSASEGRNPSFVYILAAEVIPTLLFLALSGEPRDAAAFAFITPTVGLLMALFGPTGRSNGLFARDSGSIRARPVALAAVDPSRVHAGPGFSLAF